jgi:hypothetical protein
VWWRVQSVTDGPTEVAWVFLPLSLFLLCEFFCLVIRNGGIFGSTQRALGLVAVILFALVTLITVTWVAYSGVSAFGYVIVALVFSFPDLLLVLLANQSSIRQLIFRSAAAQRRTEQNAAESIERFNTGLIVFQVMTIIAATWWRYLLIYRS